MSRSKTLYKIQQLDSELDKFDKRIKEIVQILNDRHQLDQALQVKKSAQSHLEEKQKDLSVAESNVSEQIMKIEQNQKKLYGGAITNPKELEDLQKEYNSLRNFLAILEERQLEAMLETEQAQNAFNQASLTVDQISDSRETQHAALDAEKHALEERAQTTTTEKNKYLASNSIPDLSTYEALRKSLNGIAVTLMISNSCASCGASIPSAIAQEARSPGNLVACPSCKRILHPG